MTCHICGRKRPFSMPAGYEDGWKLVERLTKWVCPDHLEGM